MQRTDLDKLSREELAHRLRHCRPGSGEWHRMRGECERRMQRWDTVMRVAWKFMLGAMFLIALSSLLGH